MLAAWQMIFGIVPLLILGLTIDGNPLRLHWTGRAVLCLLYLAVIGSSFTFLLLYWLLPRMSVTNLQTISLITPPGAIALGWAFGGERLSAWSLLGAAFVLLGVWMIFRRIEEPERARSKRRSEADPKVGGTCVSRFSQRKGCSHISELSQTIVETTKQMRNRLFGFVAHVGEAKCLAFEFAVAAVDHEMMLFAQVAHQFGDVDSTVVLHAGERDGAMPFGREKFEASRAHPVVDERVGPRVALITIR